MDVKQVCTYRKGKGVLCGRRATTADRCGEHKGKAGYKLCDECGVIWIQQRPSRVHQECTKCSQRKYQHARWQAKREAEREANLRAYDEWAAKRKAQRDAEFANSLSILLFGSAATADGETAGAATT